MWGGTKLGSGRGVEWGTGARGIEVVPGTGRPEIAQR